MAPANHQDAYYDEEADYWAGSPHLRHRRLNQWLLGQALGEIECASSRVGENRVLEVGGGDGTITESLLAAGHRVTTTEMSRASTGRVAARFHNNDRFQAVFDPDGDLASLGGESFAVVLFASVLHHIPDYLAAISSTIENHLAAGGSMVSFQDPLWYSRLPAFTDRISKASYLSWRLGQGDLIGGVKTRLRRRSSGLSEEETRDSVEYHVVREGVDEIAIADLLKPSFDSVTITDYWSTQGSPQQRLGERLGLSNTFAIFASQYRSPL